jgi:hypothetical protein
MVEIFNDIFILPFFLLLSTFSLFNIGTNFGAQDDFFGIFPEDYYDPRDYAEESATPEQLHEDETIPPEKPPNDILEKSTNSPSENESNNLNLNFIAAGDWNCNEETKKTINRINQFQPELI